MTTDLPTLSVYADTARNYRDRWHHHVPDRLEAFTRLVLTDPATGVLPAVDLGCGTGRDLAELGWAGIAAVGIDIVDEMLEFAAEACGGLPVQLLRADACFLPFPNGTCGGLWSQAGLVHLDDEMMGVALGEVARILTVGAPFEITVKHSSEVGTAGSRGRDSQGRWFRLWHPDELVALCGQVGLLADVRTEADVVRPDTTWCVLSGRRGF